MAEGAKLIEGADLAVSIQVLLKKIIEMIKKAHKSIFRLQIFRLTLKDSTSLVEDIKNLNDHFDQPREEIEKLIQEKKAGDELVGKAQKIRFWKFLVKCLSFNMIRDVKETLKEVREILETMSKDNSRHEITCSPAQNTEIVIGMEEPWLSLKMEVLKDGASTLELTGLPDQSMIWKFVGGVSVAITSLVYSALSSFYDMSFGKLGHVSYFVLPLVCLIICLPIVGAKRIRVSERVQAVMAALIFVVMSVICVLHDDKLVTRKLDTLSIMSYGSFALMSLSGSRKLELGFETGIFAFFLQLFASQLFKIKRFLLAIALVICFLIIILRYYSVRSTVWF